MAMRGVGRRAALPCLRPTPDFSPRRTGAFAAIVFPRANVLGAQNYACRFAPAPRGMKVSRPGLARPSANRLAEWQGPDAHALRPAFLPPRSAQHDTLGAAYFRSNDRSQAADMTRPCGALMLYCPGVDEGRRGVS